MCFASHQHARFEHAIFEKCSDVGVLGFLSWNLLRATTACSFRPLNFQECFDAEVFCAFEFVMACNFSPLVSPNGSAPTALARLLFDPPEPPVIGKTQCFATVLLFRASASSFLWLFLFSHLLFSSLLFSDYSHLCFSICQYCRKFDF